MTPEDAAFAKAVASGVDCLSTAERELLDADIAAAPAVLRPLMRSIVVDSAGFQRRVLDLLPQALFLLIPVLALVLALFYRRRHYPEHLYAALHLQSFVFLVPAVATLTSYTCSTMIAAIAVVAYAVIAQRRAEGPGARPSRRRCASVRCTRCSGP